RDFEGCEVVVSKSKDLIGFLPDGYGNTQEYGLLFYVEWGKDEFGAEKAKNVFVADELLKYLETLDSQNLRQFFYDLFWHEIWEHIALRGYDKKFNEYVLKNGLPVNSENFHKYISTPEFASYVAELGYETSQARLLSQMEEIISEVNKKNSEYSDVLSLFSVDGKDEYSTREKETFLAIRLGEQEVTNDCISKLAEKVYSQLEKMYITQKQKTDRNFDIRKDLDGFIEFLNKFVVVYRKVNEYMYPENLADSIKDRVVQNFSVSEDLASKISIKAYEFKEFSDKNVDYVEKLEFDNAVNQKNVFVIEDVISSQSRTFNGIYNSLMEKGAKRVYGLAFFDLSKEPEGRNLISDQTFEMILDNPQLLPEILIKLQGNTKKYVAYWLARLINDPRGTEVLENISKIDQQDVLKILIYELFDILSNEETVRGVKKYEIINIMFSVGFGRKVDLSNITKSEVDEFLLKYDLLNNKYINKVIEVSYDEWKNDIPALILYAYMSGCSFIKAVGVNDIDGTNNKYNISNMYPINDMCARYNISFEDVKRRAKYSYEDQKLGAEADEQIRINKEILQKARRTFNSKMRSLYRKYYNNVDRISVKEEKWRFLKEVSEIEKEYKDVVKKIMRNAKKITLDQLEKENIKIDDDWFMILVGGSLAKGNIMTDSDIYYNIIVPDGTISKSIDLRFAPLYSSVLQQIGLTNYHMLKYSTTQMNARSMNAFVDEQEITPFFNYEIVSLREKKGDLYDKYTKNMLKEIFRTEDNKKSVIDDLTWLDGRYSSISRQGEGWLGKSFFVSYNEENDTYFTVRPTLKSLEIKLNEIIFRYVSENGTFVFGRDDSGRILFPVSVEEQIKFVKDVIYKNDMKMQDYMEDIFDAWQYLSACRYINGNNKWSKALVWEKESVDLINTFVSENIEFKHDTKRGKIIEVKDCSSLLDVIKIFVNDNSDDNDVYRISDRKASHLDAWAKTVSEGNKDLYLFAQAVVLLIDIWSDDTKEKLENLNIKGLDKFLKEIETSINAIKFIDEKFPAYSDIAGERSIQNYWRAVAKCAGNQETMLALIAHKLTKAQISTDKEDEYLLYAVYLPLSKEFGNAEIYEYVRNDLFECSHPGAYLNLLKIIKMLYGKDYSEIPEITEKIKNGTKDFLIAEGVPDKSFDIKCRVKSLYSIYEKLTSSRRTEEKVELTEIDIKAIKCLLNFDDKLFDSIIKGAYKEKYVSTDFIKKEILGYIDKDFNSLTLVQQEQLQAILIKMKEAIFYDYRIVDFLNKNLEKTIKACTNEDGVLDEKLLEDTLKRPNKNFEYW
ncbi:MAG: hypothetical protein II816_07565, partial [Elusimicrobia bacterium]|nr:hypothetical protein [Elusimicrobiota bacterium]